MKIFRDDNESCLLELSQDEWASVGKQLGWLSQAQRRALYPHNYPTSGPGSPPGNRLDVRVEQELGPAAFAIYLAGEPVVAGKPINMEQLLCTLSLYQAALALKTLLDEIAERIA